MKARKQATETLQDINHPRMANNIIGHESAKKHLLSGIVKNKLPNSWLISGKKGIGKATLAYAFTKLLLAKNSISSEQLENWDIPTNSPTLSKIRAGSHPDIIAIEKAEDETEIKVDSIRKINHFFHLTSAETDYRIIIIDSIDDVNTNAANALLKLLEEPPENAIILMISHNPNGILTTIKSRCRHLPIRELNNSQSMEVLQTLFSGYTDKEKECAIEFSIGSPGLAFELMREGIITIYQELLEILFTPNNFPLEKSLAFSSSTAGKSNIKKWNLSCYLIEKILSITLKQLSEKNIISLPLDNKWECPHRISDLPKIYEIINNLVNDTNRIHLDKKAVMLKVLKTLWGVK